MNWGRGQVQLFMACKGRLHFISHFIICFMFRLFTFFLQRILRILRSSTYSAVSAAKT